MLWGSRTVQKASSREYMMRPRLYIRLLPHLVYERCVSSGSGLSHTHSMAQRPALCEGVMHGVRSYAWCEGVAGVRGLCRTARRGRR